MDTMPLKFSGKLDLLRRMKSWTISELAKKVGVSNERMEYLLEGKHEPRAGDVMRIMKALEIRFEPEDFEESSIP